MDSVKYSNVLFKNCFRAVICPVRSKSWRKKDHWHNLATKRHATVRALEHFDDFYKSVFRLKWPSVRLGLLSQNKYVALVNNFGETSKTEELLQNLGAMDINSVFEVYARRLKDEKSSNDREAALKQVFEMDKVLDAKFKSEEQSSLNLLYPEGDGDKLKGLLFSDDKNEASKESYFETDRIIDPEMTNDSAAMFEFVPAKNLTGMDDFVSEAEYYSYYKPTTDVPINRETQYKINFPKHLKVYTFDRGSFDEYPPPRRTMTGVCNYYLMDGASLLPVLALDIQPGDSVLDMCSAPGGKSMAILQTMMPKSLVCNEVSASRVSRIHNTLSQFLYDYQRNATWKGIVSVQHRDGVDLDDQDTYNKILVDVPCTNDRLSLRENENNIFNANRVKERLKIPETQAGLLCNALKIVKPGGTVVYSTCSLSPVQNDGVVGMALRKLWEERRTEFQVVDMAPALKHTSHFFSFGKNIGLKFGSLVVPFLPSNFGPMYFCKLVKKI